MRLDRYERVTDFLSAAGAFLGAREAEHNLILGIADTAERSADLFDGPPYLAVVHDGTDVVAAALRTAPYNLILSEMDDPAAVDLLVADLVATSLPGVIGPPAPVRAFADRWVEHRGGSWQPRMEERIYALERVVPARPAGGHSREASAADRPLLASWLDSFAREAMPTEASGRSSARWRSGAGAAAASGSGRMPASRSRWWAPARGRRTACASVRSTPRPNDAVGDMPARSPRG